MFGAEEWKEIVHFVADVPRLEKLIQSLRERIYKYYFEVDDDKIRERLKAQVDILNELERASKEELKEIERERQQRLNK